MIERFETSRAVVKRHFSQPCDTPEQGEQLIRTALTLCVLGCLTDSKPVTVFAQNKTRKLISLSAAGQLSAFYEELQQEIRALLSDHLVHRAKDDPETAIVEIIGQMSRYDRAACERGKMLLDWHSKVVAQVCVTS
ncbi:hypothetical protein DT385_09385 [Pseudomonas syringae]|nr:hypothetical protein DT385_09385 [Pseudomonas syringae]